MYVNSIRHDGLVALVRSVSEDGRRMYLEFRDGKIGTVDGSEPFDFDPGSVLLVFPESNKIEIAPQALWPELQWIGIVKIKLDDVTIVDVNGRWLKVPTHNGLDYNVGNTVEGSISTGVSRVLAKDPIKYIDFGELDESVVDEFRVEKNKDKETFEDFGGMESVVKRARELIEIPLKRRDKLRAIGARSVKGILFSGPPGTGKTMLARIIANSTDAKFYEISGPEIFSKWFGQSEELLRKIFSDAAKQEKAIIFFDEIDSIAGHRNDQSHEASKRVVAQLLVLMDGFSSGENVVIIASTNRPNDIDVALRRPGRFDWEIEFPLPELNDRKQILEVSSRRLLTKGSLPHSHIAKLTKGWSAAELSAIWTEAALLAAEDNRGVIVPEDYIGGYERVQVFRKRSQGGK